MRYFLIIATLFLCCLSAHAQTYPVQVNTQIVPPYSPYLTDYTIPGAQKLMVNILLKDLTLPEYPSKLRLTIEGVGITIRTKPTYAPPPLMLPGGGIPLLLYGEDIAEYFDPANLDFAGITRSQYQKGAKLPEGVYRFTIEVLDYNRGTPVSNKGTSVAWIILNDPPLLNFPKREAKVQFLDPTNIAFSWTPRHTASPNSAFSTEYIFKLVEIWPANRNPFDAMLTMPPLYEITTNFSQIVYGPAEPALIAGRKYAWQVQARDEEGRDLFKNQGKSEVFVFQFGDALGIPENLRLQTATPSALTVRWDQPVAGTEAITYRIRYRPAGDQSGPWYEDTSDELWRTITSLQPDKDYQVQIRAEQAIQLTEYSAPQIFRTKVAGSNDFSCSSDIQPPPQPGSTQPLFKLGINDTIRAGGYDVVVRKVSGSNGTYTGEGVAIVPWFMSAKVRVTFDKIGVNEQYWLTSGTIKSVWDANSKFLLKPETKPGNQVTPEMGDLDGTFVETETLIHITSGLVVSVTKNEDGDIVVETSSGETKVVPKGTSASIYDDAGNGYIVDKEGNIGKTTAEAAQAAYEKGQRDYNMQLSFAPGTGKFGFDEKKFDVLASYYQKLDDTDSYIPWKAISSSKTDVVDAILEGTGIDSKKIKFAVNGEDVFPQQASDNKFTLSLLGKTNDTKEELIASYQESDTSALQVIGKLNLTSYDKITKKVVIVPVNMDMPGDINVSSVTTSLGAIYEQAVAYWEVGIANRVNVSFDQSFDDGGSGLFSNYTADMKKVIGAYGQLQDETYYIFLIENKTSSGPNALGYMPRSKQAGFVFYGNHMINPATKSTAAVLRTMAHELGHGVFNLKHTFKEFPGLSTNGDNLMDYPAGAKLYKYQWDYVHDPQRVIPLFEDDEDSQSHLNSLQDHITQRLEELKKNLNAEYMAIVHCETCEDEVPNNSLKFSKVFNINEIPDFKNTSLPFNFGTKPVVADKIERISGQAKACFILYFKSADNIQATLTQSTSGIDFNQLKAPLLVVFDRENNLKKIECTSELGAWSKVICPDKKSKVEDLLNINGKYVNELITHIESCFKKGPGPIYDFTSSRLSFQDQEFLQKLYSGQLQTIWGKNNEVRHNSKAILVITDHLSGSQQMAEALALKPREGEFKIWLHKNQEELWELKSELPQNANEFFKIKDEKNQEPFTLKNFILALGQGLDDVATGVYEFFDWSSKGIAKARVPDYVWNCNAEKYEEKYAAVYKYASLIFNPIASLVKEELVSHIKQNVTDPTIQKCLDDLSDGKVEFAFYCGLWNGVIEVGRSIPELGKLVIGPLSSKGRDEFGKFLDQLEAFKKEDSNGNEVCSGTWCAIKTGLGEQFNPGNCCQFAEIIGELVIPIAISWIDPAALASAAESTSAKIIIQIIRTMQWLDKMGDPFNALKLSLRYVNTSLSVVRSQAGKVLVRIENQLVKTAVLLEDGIVMLSKPMDEVAFVTDGPMLFAKYSENGVSKMAKIIANDLVQTLEQRGASLNKLSKLLNKIDDIESLLNRLEKTGLRNANLNNFIDDLASTPDLLAHFKALNVIGADISKFSDAVGFVSSHSKIRKHVVTLNKIADLLSDTELINKLPSGRKDLTDILNSAINPLEDGTAAKLVKLSDHLENIKLIIKSHSEVPGFEQVLSDLKNSSIVMQDGISHMLNDIKNYKKGAIKKFDYEFEGDGVVCTKCRFDVEGTGIPKLIEYKSWSLENIKDISAKQLVEYFRSASSIGDIKYVFNRLKTPDLNAVKSQMKILFSENADNIFEAMPIGFRENILGAGNGDRIDLFIKSINDTNSKLYNFIEIK